MGPYPYWKKNFFRGMGFFDKKESAETAAWRASFAACAPTLETLARASDDSGRLAARSWWVTCMGNRVAECKSAYSEWRAQAAAALPSQLTVEHTSAAVGLAGFEPMARCVMDRGAAVGVQVDRTLDTVEAAGEQQQAAAVYGTAVSEVEGFRSRLHRSFLKGGLAPKAGDMGIDELRICQIWMCVLLPRSARRAAAPPPAPTPPLLAIPQVRVGAPTRRLRGAGVRLCDGRRNARAQLAARRVRRRAVGPDGGALARPGDVRAAGRGQGWHACRRCLAPAHRHGGQHASMTFCFLESRGSKIKSHRV